MTDLSTATATDARPHGRARRVRVRGRRARLRRPGLVHRAGAGVPARPCLRAGAHRAARLGRPRGRPPGQVRRARGARADRAPSAATACAPTRSTRSSSAAPRCSARAPAMEIGARNEAAVRAELRRAGIPVTATATAGERGPHGPRPRRHRKRDRPRGRVQGGDPAMNDFLSAAEIDALFDQANSGRPPARAPTTARAGARAGCARSTSAARASSASTSSAACAASWTSSAPRPPRG